MNDVKLLHAPRWTLVGTDWHMVIGNRSVARVIPIFDVVLPKYKWLSVIDCDEFDGLRWSEVDFETLEIAKYDIEQWWVHMCRGEEI